MLTSSVFLGARNGYIYLGLANGLYRNPVYQTFLKVI